MVSQYIGSKYFFASIFFLFFVNCPHIHTSAPKLYNGVGCERTVESSLYHSTHQILYISKEASPPHPISMQSMKAFFSNHFYISRSFSENLWLKNAATGPSPTITSTVPSPSNPPASQQISNALPSTSTRQTAKGRWSFSFKISARQSNGAIPTSAD